MKTYKSLVISSLMVALITFAPFASFANDSAEGVKKVEVSALTPTISGIKAPTVLKVGQMGTWVVKASDPQNGSLSYSVDFGDNSIKPLARSSEKAFVQTSTFTHAYANSGKYTVVFTVENDAGLIATSSVTVHVTGQAVSAPVISNLVATATGPRKAVVSWTTDLKSNSKVWYSKTSPVDTSGKANVSRPAEILNHKITLSRLSPNTTYYLVVGSANKRGGMTKSSEVSFTTLPLAGTTPVITSLTGPTTVMVGETETITINAYDPQNGSLTYSADWGDSPLVKSLSSRPVFVQSATFSHVYEKEGTYTATFTAENDAGQKASSSIKITVTQKADTTAPVISKIETVADNLTATVS